MEIVPPLPRLAAVTLEARLAESPLVLLTGARGVGASTLAAQLLPDHFSLSLDDYGTLAEARDFPDELVRRAPRMLIEEVQREPALLHALGEALAVEPSEPGRWLVTACAELPESGGAAGAEAARLRLWPLTRGERLGLGVAGLWGDLLDTPAEEWYDLVLEVGGEAEEWWEVARRGCLPELALASGAGVERRLREQVRRCLEQDLRDLSATSRLLEVHRVMASACRRIGEVENQAELARETGISAPTVFRYLKLLEATYHAVRLEPYAVAGTKRLVRTPKLYWIDTAVALFLAGEESPRAGHLENLVLLDLLAWRDAQLADTSVHYWRTQLGEEVDFVVEQGGRLLAVDVTPATQVTAADAGALRTFRRQYGGSVHGALLLHAGEETFWVAEGVLATPWWRVL